MEKHFEAFYEKHNVRLLTVLLLGLLAAQNTALAAYGMYPGI